MFGFIKKLIGGKKEPDTTDYHEREKESLEIELKFEMDTVVDSKAKIDELEKLCELVKNTKYHDKFKKVLDITSSVHNKFINDNIPKIKLAQFHIYYTNTFIDTYSDLTKELRVDEIEAIKKVEEPAKPVILYSTDVIKDMKTVDIIELVVKKFGLKKLSIPKDLEKYDGGSSMNNGDKYLRYSILEKNVTSDYHFRNKIKDGKFIGECDKYAVVYHNYYSSRKLFFINQNSRADDIYVINFTDLDIYELLNDISEKGYVLSNYKQ